MPIMKLDCLNLDKNIITKDHESFISIVPTKKKERIVTYCHLVNYKYDRKIPSNNVYESIVQCLLHFLIIIGLGF